MKIIFIQASVMAAMPKIHEDLYGRFKAIIIKHEVMEAILAPLEKDKLVAIGCTSPCDSSKLVQEAERMIQTFNGGGSSIY